jgi:hypothetical protein
MLRQGNELSLKPIPSTFYVLLVLNFFPNSTALHLRNVIFTALHLSLEALAHFSLAVFLRSSTAF